MSDRTASTDAGILAYALLVAGVTLLALAGYAGYVFYPRFDLPAGTGASLLLLAVAAGVASFFSPCSFPLLVTLLGTDLGMRGRTSGARALSYGASMSAGAAAFLLLVGAGIALGGATLFEGVTFSSTAGRTLRLVAGTLLVVLGLLQAGVLPGSLARVATVARPAYERLFREREAGHPRRAYAAYGFGYVLAGFG